MIKSSMIDTNLIPTPCGEPINGGRLPYVKTTEQLDSQYHQRIVTRNHIHTQDHQSHEELYEAIRHHYVHRRRKNPDVIQKHINKLQEAHRHPVYPIDWLNVNPDQILLYMDYIEHQDKRSTHAVINTWKAIVNVLTMLGYHPEDWEYTPPSEPEPYPTAIPGPDIVRRLTRTTYGPGYLGTFTRYLVYHGFFIGARPSELVTIHCADVHPDEGYLVTTEHKTGGQPNQVWLENDVLGRTQRRSIRQYMDHYRPRYENQHSQDRLYIQENGHPWTTAYLRKTITPLIKVEWQPFHLYVFRHWCAIARLIHTKHISGVFSKEEVSWHLGHGDPGSTEAYLKHAEMYYRRYPFDWIGAVLRPCQTSMGGLRTRTQRNRDEPHNMALSPPHQQETGGADLWGFEPQ